jgi:hypothetical protein
MNQIEFVWVAFFICLVGLACFSIGHDAGQNELKDQIVLGLIERDGYYIINENYGSFKLNTTDRYEAFEKLKDEISPCVDGVAKYYYSGGPLDGAG